MAPLLRGRGLGVGLPRLRVDPCRQAVLHYLYCRNCCRHRLRNGCRHRAEHHAGGHQARGEPQPDALPHQHVQEGIARRGAYRIQLNPCHRFLLQEAEMCGSGGRNRRCLYRSRYQSIRHEFSAVGAYHASRRQPRLLPSLRVQLHEWPSFFRERVPRRRQCLRHFR